MTRIKNDSYRTMVLGADDAPTQLSDRPRSATRLTEVMGAANSGPVRVAACLIDVSGSMKGRFDRDARKIDAAKRAMAALVLTRARTAPQDLFTLIEFNENATRRIAATPLSQCQQQILGTIDTMSAGGGTDIGNALGLAIDDLRSFAGQPRDVHVLTDGHDGGRTARQMADQLKACGASITVVGIGASPGDVNESLLSEIAKDANGISQYRFIRDSRTLVDHFTVVATQVTA